MCAQGRAAWLERGRRCSVQESQQQAAACHQRWLQDASLGGSSDDEDFLGVLRGPSTFANAFLYVGLGTIALGLVIAFVGTGEKGFKTTELRLIGPSLIVLGLICCILRILFCICPSHCISSSKKARKKNGAGNKVDADHTTSLLRGESKRVSIARTPSSTIQPKFPITHKRSNSKMLNEGMEALRQIASTSLFMQNEQRTAANRVVPIIKEPENPIELPLEMKKLEKALKIDDDEDEAEESNRKTKIREMREAIATNTNTTTTTAVPNRAKTKSAFDEQTLAQNSAANKLARQRFAFHQPQSQEQQQQQVTTQHSQSQSLSSSSTVKDSIAGDDLLIIETSLVVDKPTQETEIRPPPVLSNSNTTGTTPRLKTTTISASKTLPGLSTGAISRQPLSMIKSTTQAAYDLPSATPHSYTTATTTYRSDSPVIIRGPLGTPLSILTASSSSYALPASNIAPTPQIMPPTTTTVSLLPLPAPPTINAVAPSIADSAHLPGQVLPTNTTNNLSILLPRTTTPKPQTPPTTNLVSYRYGAISTSASSSASSNGRATLAPTNKNTEPELVLSPAKLGQ